MFTIFVRAADAQSEHCRPQCACDALRHDNLRGVTVSAGESVLARMSFDADGRLVAVRDAAAAAVPATERDILRQVIAELRCIYRGTYSLQGFGAFASLWGIR